MDPSESIRSRAPEGSADGRDVGVGDEEDWEGDEKGRHRGSKSRKHGGGEDAVEHDSGRRRSSGDRSDGRKRPSSSSRASSGDDDYDVRRESSSKSARRTPEGRGDRRSNDGYQDREAEGSRRIREEESSSRKATSKYSGQESSQSKSRSKEGNPCEGPQYTERKESGRERSHGQRGQESYSQHRRSEDNDTDRRDEKSGRSDKDDSRSIQIFDNEKHRLPSDRTLESMRSDIEKNTRSTDREERRVDPDGGRSRSRSEPPDEDNRSVTTPSDARLNADRGDTQEKAQGEVDGLGETMELDDHSYSSKPHGDKSEKHKLQTDSAHGARDEAKTREKSVDMDEDRHRMRDRTTREVGRGRRSRSPERSGRHRGDLDGHDQGFTGPDNERSFGFKSTESEGKYRDDRSSKGKDSTWIHKNREGEGSKEQWNRSQTWQDAKDGDSEFDHVRQEKERVDGDKFRSRPGYRRDNRIRTEGGRLSSNFGSQNENYDRIEIIPINSFAPGREEPFSMTSGRRSEPGSQHDFASRTNEEWGHAPEDNFKQAYSYADDFQERFRDDSSLIDQNFRKYPLDSQRLSGQKGPADYNHPGVGQSPSSSSQTSFGNNQGSGSFNRAIQQGARPGRGGRGGRLTARETPRIGVPLPIMGSPFGHLGLRPSPMQPMTPNMPHSPGPPMGPGVLIPPFPGPLIWPGARGVDMNILGMPPNLPPIPSPGLAGVRFPLNIGPGANHDIFFNQPDPGRPVPPNISNERLNAMGTNGRGASHDRASIGWGPSKNSGPSGKAPSRGEQNDYSQNFVDTGLRPQNFIRELELTSVVEDYPKLRELIQKKDEIVANSASPPMYYKCDLHEQVLSPEFFGTKFDVILVDPPWEEYVHRAPGVTDHTEYWPLEEIQNLKIEAIADTPSFIFLWVGDGVGLEQGRQCLKKWGFRRCEDICWVKTNKSNATPSLRHDSHTLFQHSKEHCLMGIKGTVRRSIDGHIIHANIDTDVIIAEEPPYGSTKKPDDMYRIIEHFSLGKRRLELFGEDHNIRSGWLTVGKLLSSSNFNSEAYIRNFADGDGKVWQGGGGRNPPPDAPHLVVTTPDIESLRPKSPPPKNQQQPIPLMPPSSSNSRRAFGNSLQNTMASSSSNMNDSLSEPPTPVPWGASPMIGIRGPEGGHGGPDDKFFDGYGFNPLGAQTNCDNIDFESHSAVNML